MSNIAYEVVVNSKHELHTKDWIQENIKSKNIQVLERVRISDQEYDNLMIEEIDLE
jgi:hypothetical protein